LNKNNLIIKIYNETLEATPLLKDEKDENTWRHIAFSWDSKGGKWNVLVDGNRIRGSGHFGSGLLLPASGKCVLFKSKVPFQSVYYFD
jgi:hypothetical protein